MRGGFGPPIRSMAASKITRSAIGDRVAATLASSEMLVRFSSERHVRSGSWLCKNTLSQGPEWDEVLMRTGLSGFDYARIAAISGCMPIMFITLVRL